MSWLSDISVAVMCDIVVSRSSVGDMWHGGPKN